MLKIKIIKMNWLCKGISRNLLKEEEISERL